MTQQLPTRLSVHEAGHAVIGWLYKIPFQFAEIGEDGGFVQFAYHWCLDPELMPPRARALEYSRRADVACAGAAAEAVIWSDPLAELRISQTDFEMMGGLAQLKKPSPWVEHLWKVERLMRRPDINNATLAFAYTLDANRKIEWAEGSDLIARYISPRWPRHA